MSRPMPEEVNGLIDGVSDKRSADAPSPDPQLVWGVGSVAERLGIAASTLRTWERRYDVGPTHRTVGGHRRYTERDIVRVALIQRLIGRGAPPRDAARVAHGLDEGGLDDALAAADTDDEGADLTPAEAVEAMVAGCVAHDAARVGALVSGRLRREGVVVAWTTVLAPALIRIGQDWSAGRLGVDVEHLASECVITELKARTRAARGVNPAPARVVLASAEDELHSLPLIALESAVAESGHICHLLGARVPSRALSGTVRSLRPAAVFLWASMERSDDDQLWKIISSISPATTVMLGGPGWQRAAGARGGRTGPSVQSDLRSTVHRIGSLVG